MAVGFFNAYLSICRHGTRLSPVLSYLPDFLRAKNIDNALANERLDQSRPTSFVQTCSFHGLLDRLTYGSRESGSIEKLRIASHQVHLRRSSSLEDPQAPIRSTRSRSAGDLAVNENCQPDRDLPLAVLSASQDLHGPDCPHAALPIC